MMDLSLIETVQKTAAASHFTKVGIFPHHGILVPLASIHTEQSSGIGEFFDLIPLIDWCKEVGFDLVQILPLNNSPGEPSPYLCESACALNPIYLSLTTLPGISSDPSFQERLRDLRKLTASDSIDYLQVSTQKLSLLRDYFQAQKSILQTAEYCSFIEREPWIKPYALFKVLKDQWRNLPWKQWPSHLQCLQKQAMEALYPLYADGIEFYSFLQYLCYSQMRQVQEHAKQRGILLMGDLPMFLSQESSESWQFVELFSQDLGAGAPPDMYNPEGQNWNLPIFNWEALRKEGYPLWKKRLTYAENFYDLFRVDHILGFFRVFAIPFHKSSLEGRYIPEEAPICVHQAEEILSMMLSSTQMLPIGEDLGEVPPYVRPCLKRWGISGTRVMRWEKKGVDQMLSPQEYEPLSLCCLSTHDSEPLSLLWKSCKEEAKLIAKSKGWEYQEELTLQEREELLRDCHKSSSLFHVNPLQEYLSFIPEFVHKDPEKERINHPGFILPSNWTYRYIPSIEKIQASQILKARIQKILA